jgi:hypothetical protein
MKRQTPRMLILLVGTMCCSLSLFGAPAGRNVLFDPQRVPEMRKLFATDPLFKDLREKIGGIDRAAERAFMKTGMKTNDQLTDIARVGDLAQ